MKSVVVAGGTDGIGRALAEEYLNRGDEVLVIGQNPAKGEAFLEAARGSGAGDRVHFVPADLSLISENERVLDLIGRTFPVLDLLVLCARYHRAVRTETAEGLESTFALFYLSRFLLGHGLAPALARAQNPVILNVAGPGSSAEIPWKTCSCAATTSEPARWGSAGGSTIFSGPVSLRRIRAARFAMYWSIRELRRPASPVSTIRLGPRPLPG